MDIVPNKWLIGSELIIETYEVQIHSFFYSFSIDFLGFHVDSNHGFSFGMFSFLSFLLYL